MQSAELFAGCGGLALGMSRAGFQHQHMAEFDQDAVATVLHNKTKGVEHVRDWPMGLQDVREIDWTKLTALDLVSGGPPCQPFGIGGKKHGQDDHRDMWPEAIRAVREAGPRSFLFENVRNLAGPRFRPYLEWIIAHLERPGLVRTSNESHAEHRARLAASKSRKEFNVVWQLVNAADYGAAQIRHRVLIFGIRSDLDVPPALMIPTHSRDRLLWEQYVTGEYWVRHGLRKRERPILQQDRARVEKLRRSNIEPVGSAWITVRDALDGLGEPDGRSNHILQLGARVYPGHTGSPLDLPAKALKAGDHGVPGGENMMVRDDGSVRYFTTREAARLVGLPDDYEFPRSWTESMRQLGNAVPAPLGAAAGRWLATQLDRARASDGLASTRRAA
ncbi:DNA cytosine methyltransferase [Mesorhizobium sp. CO1-1-11]|uniref:DNA cytosine methyltransferase n=1 Tax=Mesorhizobium sp. CO1-1-11 TaxID=2876636 RepID=UPI001CCF203C|nr:DNA (cytosine-5-)-methyltransferase [Mesorhizobium sp. CO1-1-11]MBZ9726354.1 DNA cytosine methyltransferase [Mesorhizobium sp. CO1-1-11]